MPRVFTRADRPVLEVLPESGKSRMRRLKRKFKPVTVAVAVQKEDIMLAMSMQYRDPDVVRVEARAARAVRLSQRCCDHSHLIMASLKEAGVPLTLDAISININIAAYLLKTSVRHLIATGAIIEARRIGCRSRYSIPSIGAT